MLKLSMDQVVSFSKLGAILEKCSKGIEGAGSNNVATMLAGRPGAFAFSCVGC